MGKKGRGGIGGLGVMGRSSSFLNNNRRVDMYHLRALALPAGSLK